MGEHLSIVELRAGPFDPLAILQRFFAEAAPAAAVASFCGRVRGKDQDGRRIDSLFIEHYPGMAEQCMLAIAQRARRRWQLSGLIMVHRHGTLAVDEPIVLTAAAAVHRDAAFSACRMMIDCLKSEVPLWKQESGPAGSAWVQAKAADEDGAQAWQE